MEPRIFPGLVHERTRTGSLKRESGSEQDFDPVASGSISDGGGAGWRRGSLENSDRESRKAVMSGKSDQGSSDGDTQ